MTAATTLRPVDPKVRKKLSRVARTAADKTIERDRLIAYAYLNGASMREIARTIGMTHPGVRAILIRDGAYHPDLENPIFGKADRERLRRKIARDINVPIEDI